MAFEVPELRTTRLKLRAPTITDFPAYEAFYGDSEASHFYGGPKTTTETWQRLCSDVGHWVLRGYGVWAIEIDTAVGCIGICGLYWPEGWPRPELTWWIAPEARRQGIAAEASHAAIDWALSNGWSQVETHMRDENIAARHLVAKLGGEKIAREEFPDGIVRDVFGLSVRSD